MDTISSVQSLSRPLKSAEASQVSYLFLVETVNTGCDIAMMYQPLIMEYGAQNSSLASQ